MKICYSIVLPDAMQVIGRRATNRAKDAGRCRCRVSGSVVSVEAACLE